VKRTAIGDSIISSELWDDLKEKTGTGLNDGWKTPGIHTGRAVRGGDRIGISAGMPSPTVLILQHDQVIQGLIS
jgi:hypothetical protein